MTPRSKPHPLALFSLRPLNDRALQVLKHQSNEHFVSRLDHEYLGLDVGHVRSLSGDPSVLATLGRNGDIFVQGASISKIQCSFEIDQTTKTVMFYDRSHSQTSAVLGDNAYPFQYDRARKVVVHQRFNTSIGMGGRFRDLVQFELVWHEREDRAIELHESPLEPDPRFARTIDDNDTSVPSRYDTRAHTPSQAGLEMRCFRGARLGTGSFADVYKGINVDSGQVLAIKVMNRPNGLNHVTWKSLQREVMLLRTVNHPHIIDYIHSRWESNTAEIFMGLKDGSLEGLVHGTCVLPITTVAETVLHQMLQAIGCLAAHRIVHRDIKPANILYVFRQSQYHFCLGDFGMSNHQRLAVTCVGTPYYMAPEMLQEDGNGKQTHQADVWSLFVTILWTLDIRGFRQALGSSHTVQEIRTKILTRALDLSMIIEMAREDPDERASAAQMLVKCFDGKGLVTPRSRIPSLAPPPVPLDTKAPLLKPKRVPKKAEPTAAFGRVRVEKSSGEKRPSSNERQQMPGRFPAC